MPRDVELEQLRLIDDFLEDGENLLADDAFDPELEQAVMAVAKSKLRRIRAAFEREKDDTWVTALRNTRLIFGKPEAL
ncbi:hypothetical protein [Sphingomonas sp. Leaf21]|jgi:hypothetical protein|uniref:hypothetical protein n=1 Tax=Sphingomonas sp. Leaf21 TaxID=2876550 RepID=UPI001E5BBDCD|nr:hypothetical protein [Sphingomonas sp. Leaf21]